MAGIGSGVWGTPANFNGFHVMAMLLRATGSEHQPNFAALNRGRYLYSAARPSRWALAHILVIFSFSPDVLYCGSMQSTELAAISVLANVMHFCVMLLV